MRRTGIRSNPLVWSGLACIALVALITLRRGWGGGPEAQAADGSSLPVLSQVPAFELINQDSLPTGRDQLLGRVWVANFIFTRCPSICPKLTAKMAEFQRRTRSLEGLRLVSFSVDPEYDTPEVLKKYAAKYGADTSSWSFLTGPLQVVKDAIEDGLRVSMGQDGEVTNVNEIFHGPHFVLVDDRARIRGYFDVEDPAGFENLIDSAGRLVTTTGQVAPAPTTEN